MEQEYITIKEFAKRANVSVQSIYKRLNGMNNPLNQYVEMVDNQKMLNIKALHEIYGLNVEQPIQPNDSTCSTLDEAPKQEEWIHKNDLLELENRFLKEKIEVLEDEKVAWKDQIQYLNLRLEESQRLLNQQQQLCAVAQKKIEEIEARKEEKKAWWKFWE